MSKTTNSTGNPTAHGDNADDASSDPLMVFYRFLVVHLAQSAAAAADELMQHAQRWVRAKIRLPREVQASPSVEQRRVTEALVQIHVQIARQLPDIIHGPAVVLVSRDDMSATTDRLS